MTKLTRRYIYQEDYDFIMRWGKRNNIQNPNLKPNFPRFLEEFLNQKRV